MVLCKGLIFYFVFLCVGLQLSACFENNGNRTCPNLKRPNNGDKYGECWDATPGARCYFRCDAGFSHNGPSYVYCKETGEWDEDPPLCQGNRTCPDLSRPNNGDMYGECWDATPRDRCYFQCYNETSLIGPSYLYCKDNGEWDEDPPVCERVQKCENLQYWRPSNGSMYGRCWDASPNDTCHFYCYDGFRLIGSSVLLCTENGYWDERAPYCEGLCTDDIKGMCRQGGAICETNSTWSATCNCTDSGLTWNDKLKKCTGQTCNDIKEGSSETWHVFCNRMENSVCMDSGSGESPRCVCKPGCSVGTSGKCVCSRGLKLLLRGNATFNVEVQIEYPYSAVSKRIQ